MEFNKKLSKFNYEMLLAQIKSRAAASSAIRQAAGNNSGLTRYLLRDMKRKMRMETRILLWCLAILKERKLTDIEPNSVVENRPTKEMVKRKLSLYQNWDKESVANLEASVDNFFEPAKEKAA